MLEIRVWWISILWQCTFNWCCSGFSWSWEWNSRSIGYAQSSDICYSFWKCQFRRTKWGLYWGRCGSLLIKQHVVHVQGSSMIDLRFPFFQIDFMWALRAKHAICNYINKLHIPQAPFLRCLNPKLWNGRFIQYFVDIFGQQCCPTHRNP